MGLSKQPVLLVALGSLLLSSCGGINVMGRKVSDREYKAGYDSSITREKMGLRPDGAHDEHGRIPSWDAFWNNYMGGHDMSDTSTAQSRRLHRYIVSQRRKAGLPELSTPVE
ncbi:MAG: hypothetical protein JWR15_3795 [Prosthecobacter sp.]|nr:hypothetical protein [Prosthecobacter sp.]